MLLHNDGVIGYYKVEVAYTLNRSKASTPNKAVTFGDVF